MAESAVIGLAAIHRSVVMTALPLKAAHEHLMITEEQRFNLIRLRKLRLLLAYPPPRAGVGFAVPCSAGADDGENIPSNASISILASLACP